MCPQTQGSHRMPEETDSLVNSAAENVRLFHEIQEKSRQLAEASQHKSQFLANMISRRYLLWHQSEPGAEVAAFGECSLAHRNAALQQEGANLIDDAGALDLIVGRCTASAIASASRKALKVHIG